MRILYQVAGRLPGSSEDYSIVNYSVEDVGENLEGFRISSDALRSLKPDESRVVILFPVSLFYDRIELLKRSGSLEGLERDFSSAFRQYMKGEFDSFVIQSTGRYRNVEFKSDYDLVVLRIMARMIQDYLKYQPGEVIVDISTGLNVNVSALLEAFRYFLIWVKLFTYGKGSSTRFYRAFSELIMEADMSKTYRIHLKETSAKAFFLSPLNVPDLRNLPQEVDGNMLGRFLITFTALYRNAPLYLYHAGFDRASRVLNEIQSLLHKIVSRSGEYSMRDEKTVEFPLPFDRRKMTNVLLSLALYARTAEILEEYLGDGYQERYSQRGISTGELREVFVKGIYERLGLEMNAFLLNNELGNIEKAINENRNRSIKYMYSRQFYPLSYAFTGDISENQCGDNYRPNPRNFLAHAGFERCMVLARGSGDDIRLVYRKGKDVEEFIENTLLNIDPTF